MSRWKSVRRSAFRRCLAAGALGICLAGGLSACGSSSPSSGASSSGSTAGAPGTIDGYRLLTNYAAAKSLLAKGKTLYILKGHDDFEPIHSAKHLPRGTALFVKG